MNWADFFTCWLRCNNVLVRSASYSIPFTFKCRSTVIALVRPLAVAEIGSVHLSLLWFVWVFFWNSIIRFLWIFAWRQKPLWSCAWRSDFFEKLHKKLRKWTENRVSEFKEKSGRYFSLNLFYNKNFYYCCVHARIVYLGKILFLRYRPKYCQPVRLQDF